MRRLILLTLVFTAICWCQVPRLEPAPSPITVKVEMPPTPAQNPWFHLAELIIPGLIGAGIAFMAVLWTNKRNAAENAANRDHQLKIEIAKTETAAKYKSEDNRWAFRKDVYVNLITALSGLIRVHSSIGSGMKLLLELQEQKTRADDPRFKEVLERMIETDRSFNAHGENFGTYVSLSPLAIAEDVVPLVTSAWIEPLRCSGSTSAQDWAKLSPERIAALSELLRTLQSAGRKDLWGTPEAGGEG